MKPIELNLASNPYRNDGPLTVGLALLAVVALLFTGFNAYAYLTADDTKSRLETQLASHKATMSAMRSESEEIREELAAIDAEVLGAQASFVSGILAQRNFSWTALLNSLEEVLPWNVRLSIIRPEFGSMGRVTLALRGTARNVEAFYDFQDALQSSLVFSEVVPGNWQYADRDSLNEETVEFLLSCRYEQNEPENSDGEGEAEQASLPLQDEPVDERIVVEGEPAVEPAVEPASEGALLDAEPQTPGGRSSANVAPAESAAAPARPERRDETRSQAGSTDTRPMTREERRAARRAARQGDSPGGFAQAPGAGAGTGNTNLRSRSGSRTIPGALGGSAGQGARTGDTAAADGAARGAGTDPNRPPEQQPPKVVPEEELVEVGKDGVKNLKLRPAPERPSGSEEQGAGQGAEQGQEGGSSGSGSSEQGSSGSSGSGSSSGGSSSGGSSSGGQS